MLVILSGVSGAGKDTVKKKLMNKMEECYNTSILYFKRA